MGEWITQQEKNNRESTAAQVAMLGAIGAILSFLFWLFPRVIGTVAGFILGLCFKIGIVGKIITTILVAALGFILAVICTQGMVQGDGITLLGILQGVICFGVLGGVGFWWFKFHYETIRHNDIPYTTSVIKRCAVIVFYGFFGILLVLGIVIELIMKKKLDWGIVTAIAFFVPFAIAFFFTYLPDMVHPKLEKYAKKGAAGASAADDLPAPSTGKNYAEGDFIWARWSEDGNLYFAQIKEAAPAAVRVLYYDGHEEDLSKKDIFYLDEAQKSGLKPHGNWEGKGSFYPCKILSLNETTVNVKYTQDGIEEELPYEGLVFLN